MLTVRSPRVNEAIPGCRVRLASHQLAMVRRCLEIEKSVISTHESYGIMRDLPGTGKTYVVLALISLFANASKLHGQPVGTNVVVVPQHVYAQWLQAAGEFELTVKEFNRFSDVSESREQEVSGAEPDVLLTTPAFLPMIAELTSLHVHRCIVDEPQPGAKTLDAKMTWYVSASISVDDPRRTCHCEKAFVEASFGELDFHPFVAPERTFVRCRNVVVSRVLTRLYSGADLVKVFAGEFGAGRHSAGALVLELSRELAGKVAEKAKHMEEIAKRQRYLPQAEVDRLGRELSDARKREATLEDALFEGGVCFACVRPIVGEAYVSACTSKKMYCEACATLPTCQACGKEDCVARRFDGIPVYTRDDAENNDKVHVLARLLATTPSGARVIVVSAHGFETLRKRLPPELLDLTTDALEEYAAADESNKSILLMDPTHFACGSNLARTTDVVFLHKLGDMTETQVLGRALRPPRRAGEALRTWYLRYDVEHVVLMGASPP